MFGSCVEEIDVSVGVENSQAQFEVGVEISKIYFGRESGSRLVLEGRYGARDWGAFWGV